MPFDSTFRTADFIYTNDDKTAQRIVSAWASTRGTTEIPPTAPKCYWEYLVVGTVTNQTLLGLADTAWVGSSYVGSVANSLGIWNNGGITYLNGGSIGSFGAYGVNDRIGVYFDPATGKVWLTKNNVQLSAGGDPVAGINPIATMSPAITYRPFSTGGVNTVTIATIQVDLAITPLTGFVPLDGGAAAEHAYGFDIRVPTEQFYNYRTAKAPFYQAGYRFQARPALRIETGYLFDIDRAKQFDSVYNFDLIAYKQYQDTYDFAIRAGQVFTEQDYPFTISTRLNELYEEMFTLRLNGLIDNFSVKAGLSTIVDSVALDALQISGGRNGYYNLFRVQVPYDQRFLTLGLGGLASLTWHSARLVGDTVVPVVDKSYPLVYKQFSAAAAATDQGDVLTATLDLVSKTAQLGGLPDVLFDSDSVAAYGSLPVDTVWPAGTLASEVLDDLCLPYLPYMLEYGDYPLLQALDGGQRYPIEIINELYPLAWIGPDSDGNLLIRSKMIRGWTELLAPDFDDYDLELAESEYAIDIQQDYPVTPMFNAITVRTVAASDSVVFPAPEIVQDENDPSKATVYGYRYPWVPFDLITCNTECGNVQISAGAEEIVEVTEALDFEGGAASFPWPVHEFVSVDWGCNRSLGTITASGDGTLQAAVSGWSFGAVTCNVRRMVFQVTAYNGRADDLKFRLRDDE